MATTTQTYDTPTRVQHPLQAVRSHIRRYVLLESVAVVLFFLAAWFWVALALDYGLFYLLGFDWVQELNFVDPGSQASRGIRIGVFVVMLGVLGYFLVSKLFVRYWKEFSDSAIALVLERRFPRELGDRLITAVELADPKKAESYGFSGEMIAQTIREAGERVEKLPVSDVFDWARLRRQWIGVFLATVGMFIAVGILSGVVQQVRGGPGGPVTYFWNFRDVSSIGLERGVLFENSYWLRNAHLEVVRFQDEGHLGEMRVGRDEQRPDLIVRAVQWVVPDREAPAGWRPLRVGELVQFLPAELLTKIDLPEDWPHWIVDLDDLDRRVPTGVAPAAWQGKSVGEVREELKKTPSFHESLQKAGAETAVANLGNWKTWTFDKLLLQVARPEVQKHLEGKSVVKGIEAIQTKLEEVAASPAMSRRLRKLDVPTEVGIAFRGATTKATAPGESQLHQKFSFNLGDLKESVTFYVRGGDFVTPPLKITLVPPPTVKELSIDKEEPAYLFHRLQGSQAALKGKKQIFTKHKVSVTGETSSIDVPFGSNVTLTAQVDRKLKDGIRIRPAGQAREQGVVVPDNAVTRSDDHLGFHVRFDNVVKTMEFQFEFNDEDNVKGKRRVRIRPIDDFAPEILNWELALVLRKPRFKEGVSKALAGAASDGFLITPDANLPFSGTVRDDVGLTNLAWAFDVQPIVIQSGIGKEPAKIILQGNPAIRRASLIVSALQFSPTLPTQAVMAPSYLNLVKRVLDADLKLKAVDSERRAGLADFQDRLLRLEEIPLDQLGERLLEKPKTRPHLREHILKDNEFFNMKLHLPDLKVKDVGSQSQQFYLMKLALEATDNNVETGPSVSRTRTPLTFLVVPETELLAQISLEEEVLRDRLEKVVQKLKAAQTTMFAQLPSLKSPGPEIDYSLVVLRLDEVRKALQDSGVSTREIFQDYSRILRELEVNNVKAEKIKDIREKVVQKLDAIVHPTFGGFALTEDVLQRLYAGLDDDVQAKQVAKNIKKHVESAEQTNDQLLSLIEEINAILLAIDRGLDFNEILQRVIAIEQGQRTVVEPLRVYQDGLIGDLLKGLTDPAK